MVGAAGLFGEPEVPGDRAPLTLGADAAVAVGAGGSLTAGAKTGDYGKITETARQFVEKIRAARGQ